MERKKRKQRNVYIYYRYEDRQWLLDLNSTGRKEILQSKKELQILYDWGIYNVPRKNDFL